MGNSECPVPLLVRFTIKALIRSGSCRPLYPYKHIYLFMYLLMNTHIHMHILSIYPCMSVYVCVAIATYCAWCSLKQYDNDNESCDRVPNYACRVSV